MTSSAHPGKGPFNHPFQPIIGNSVFCPCGYGATAPWHSGHTPFTIEDVLAGRNVMSPEIAANFVRACDRNRQSDPTTPTGL